MKINSMVKKDITGLFGIFSQFQKVGNFVKSFVWFLSDLNGAVGKEKFWDWEIPK